MSFCTICAEEYATDRTATVVHCNLEPCETGAKLLVGLCHYVATGEIDVGIFWVGKNAYQVYSNGSFEPQR